MATARELLEQADALMRRNRLRDAAVPVDAGDFPVLTDVVAADAVPSAAALPEPWPESDAVADALVPAAAPGAGAPASADADVPVLTEIVEDFEPISVMGAPETPVEAREWPDFDAGEIPVAAPLPVAAAPAPAVAVQEDFAVLPKPAFGWDHGDVAPPPARAAEDPLAIPGASAPVGDPDAARWDALAEDVRMQVLQRIDIFTDTGLQAQLTARLQPIVDRASADLVATINQQVGQLMRSYVAEAIEREIEKWRHDGA